MNRPTVLFSEGLVFGFVLRVFVLRGFGFFLRLVPRAAPAIVPRLQDEGRFGLEKGGLIAAFTDEVNNYFYFFRGHSLSQDSVQKGTPLGASP